LSRRYSRLLLSSVTISQLAAGAGSQYKLGAFALRAEYEYFNTGGANSGLVSLGITWTFL
jgi:hypothetical protein